ncbi:hypothetical protein TYRP_020803 [Tyrophagus putrescentiae]|nr:hypothetical protein TYRP_020803 [Tyrophagus putrescentiae]
MVFSRAGMRSRPSRSSTPFSVAVGKVSLDVAVHGNGHLLKSGHEVGSSEHHSLLHVRKIADQTADQGEQSGASGDDVLTVEAAVAVALLLHHHVLLMPVEEHSWIHHQPGVSSVEVADGSGGHEAHHPKANEDLCQAAQVTAHGGEQVLLGGQRVAPVGADGQSAKGHIGGAK